MFDYILAISQDWISSEAKKLQRQLRLSTYKEKLNKMRSLLSKIKFLSDDVWMSISFLTVYSS